MYSTQVSLDAELLANESCKDTKEKDGGCKDYYKLLQVLAALRDSGLGEDGNDNGDFTSDGETPLIIGGGTQDVGETPGPKFSSGRLTWTDVVPD